jgi:hypothetical protein
MTLNVTLSPEKERRLRERAQASGQDLSAYVSRLLEQFAEPPTPLEVISGELYREFAQSGMSDDELGDLLEKAKHEMRAERRARKGE